MFHMHLREKKRYFKFLGLICLKIICSVFLIELNLREIFRKL